MRLMLQLNDVDQERESDMSKKSDTSKNVHKGHRERLKRQFTQKGVDCFYDHQLLELLLFYSIPREDTNPVAHALLDRFGSISGVLNADYDDLLTVDGVGSNTAFLLKFLPEFFTRYMLSGMDGERLNTTSSLCHYFLCKLAAVQNEQLWLTCLDDKSCVVSSIKISEGNGSSVFLDNNKILMEVLKSKCTNFVLAHNHPFGDSRPSVDDIKLTEAVRTMIENSGKNLIDHIIVSRTEARSMFHNEAVVLVDDQEE